MPEDKNILYRYKLLNECLSDRSKYYNIDDIVRYCNSKLFSDGFKGISKRTIQYDMNRIECLYGLEIDRDFKFNGRTCYRYKDEGASIPGFNVEDKDLVKIRRELERMNDIFRKLERFEGIPMFEWIPEMRLRLDDAINNDFTSPIVSFESGNLDVNKLKFLNVIYKAIVGHKTLEISGFSFSLNQNYKKIISPYMLKQYNCRWYLICKVKDSDVELECLPLDRMSRVVEANKRYVGYDGNVDEYYDDVIGVTVYAGAKPIIVKLKVDDKTLPYVISRPLHWSQKQDKECKNIIKIEVIDNYELRSKIRSYGSTVEVLEPQYLRDEFKKECMLTLNNYQTFDNDTSEDEKK